MSAHLALWAGYMYVSCQCCWAWHKYQSADSHQLCCMCVGHSGPGALQDHHHCLLPWGHGLHPNVWHHKRGVFWRCAGLVSCFGLFGVNIWNVVMSVFVFCSVYCIMSIRSTYRKGFLFVTIMQSAEILLDIVRFFFFFASHKTNLRTHTGRTVTVHLSDISQPCFCSVHGCIHVRLANLGKLVKVVAPVHSWVTQAPAGWTEQPSPNVADLWWCIHV